MNHVIPTPTREVTRYVNRRGRVVRKVVHHHHYPDPQEQIPPDRLVRFGILLGILELLAGRSKRDSK